MGKKAMKLILLVIVFLMSSTMASANLSSTQDKNKSPKEDTNLVTGTIMDGNILLKNSTVLIQEKGSSKLIQTVTDARGSFTTKLKDGTYGVKGVKGKNSSWYSTNQSFEVRKGKVKGINEEVISLTNKKEPKKPTSKSANLFGTLSEDHSGLKAELLFFNYNEYEEEIYSVTSKSNGSFSASLPDGTYYLYGIEFPDGFYRYELEVVIANGQVYVDGVQQTNVTINIPANAYHGKVSDSNAAISSATVILEKRLSDEEYDTDFIQATFTNKKGEYSLRSLVDGTYSISVYHETYSSWNEQTFNIVNGEVYISGQKVTDINLSIPELTLKGTLLEGKTPIKNAYIVIEKKDENDYYSYGVQVDSKGNFQYRLPDGQYEVLFIEEPTRSSTISLPFEIINGKIVQNGQITSTLTIQVPAVTFSGKLLDSGIALQGSVSVASFSDDGSAYNYYATTNENGVFSLRLTDGSYQLTSAYLFDEGEEVSFFTSFDIQNGKVIVDGEEQELLELQIPPVSLHGSIVEGGHPITEGYVTVMSKDNYLYSWKQVNSDGTFTMRLPDGNYSVIDVQLYDGTSTNLNQDFSIINGQTYVDDQPQDVLTILLPPVSVTGTLLEEGNAIHGSIYIMEINNADNPLEAWGMTNEEGKFQLRLPDGEYKVYDVYLHDGTLFSPQSEFSVKEGQLYINGEIASQLTIEVTPVTLTGTVSKEGYFLNEGYVAITSVDGNWTAGYYTWIQEGIFKARLPEGDYLLNSVYDYQSDQYYYFDKSFSIKDGKLFINGQNVDSLDLHVENASQ
ncbi:carboxypeptidase regulatory-like domain-containing protein [Robertmurraya sp. P23]|uniref:carboxypeptidase regulatory-like domain-containing protein n=1 Tax=Robertmurraya sp. P23 TaxID=3436931 RepID=UPI003D98CF7D